jgi:hypothetical protein
MKDNRKILALVLAFTLLLSLAACGNSKNTAPTISGVRDMTVVVGSEFDAFEGVTALDAEDGDLTSKIVIDSNPPLKFKNGKVTPEEEGTYELTYSVADKGGLKAETYATLTVTRKTGDAVVYKDFDFSTQPVTDNRGWEARIADGVDASAEMKQGAYVFEIASPGNDDDDIQLAKPGFALKAADYRIKIWAKSTADTYCHIIARDEDADGWATFGGAYNLVIGKEISPLELNFTSKGKGSAELLLNLGKITPNPDNPSDTTPENFTVTIDKIEIYEITGDETLIPAYTSNFSTGKGVTVEAGDGAVANVSFSDDAATVNITSYPTNGGVWSIKSNIELGDQTIENGTKYYYSLKLKAKNAQSGECIVESAAQYDKNRVHFNSFTVAAGEEIEISGTFTADRAISDPVIRLQIGNPSDGVSSNSLAISDVVFGKVEGDKEVKKTIDNFIAFGNSSYNATNPEYPWAVFNGTDEDYDRGVGTIWTENGSLFYRIDQGSTTDWHNKLICGYNGNPLTLKADSYYTIEIKVKATKNVSCGLFLNPIGGWDPRLSERLDITTEEQTFKFTTTDTFITDMDFELLFQFGSEDLAQLGEVTVEFSDIKIYQMSVI